VSDFSRTPPPRSEHLDLVPDPDDPRLEHLRVDAEARFAVEALYGWFDRRAWGGGEDQIWVCRRARLTS